MKSSFRRPPRSALAVISAATSLSARIGLVFPGQLIRTKGGAVKRPDWPLCDFYLFPPPGMNERRQLSFSFHSASVKAGIAKSN